MDEVPAGKLWVHCGTGYRAGVAASLLQRAGRDVVHLDAKFEDARKSGVPPPPPGTKRPRGVTGSPALYQERARPRSLGRV